MNSFEKSEKINELAKALCQFQSACPNVELNAKVKVKTKAGGHYFFEYATLPHINETIRPHLKEAKLSYTQLVNGGGGVKTILMHESGQYVSSFTNLEVKLNGLQEMGSKITYLKRYALTAILGITAENDDDGNGADGNTMTPKGSDSTNSNNNNNKKPWLNEGSEDWKKLVDVILSKDTITVSLVREKKSVSKKTARRIEEILEVKGKILKNEQVDFTDYDFSKADFERLMEFRDSNKF